MTPGELELIEGRALLSAELLNVGVVFRRPEGVALFYRGAWSIPVTYEALRDVSQGQIEHRIRQSFAAGYLMPRAVEQ